VSAILGGGELGYLVGNVIGLINGYQVLNIIGTAPAPQVAGV
jgi:hypothetical protein